jgi:hypothetical protein
MQRQAKRQTPQKKTLRGDEKCISLQLEAGLER